MTIQEAIDHINYDRQEDIPKEALEMAITALERQKEYGRHDLRKDPKDNPKTKKPIIIYFSNGVIGFGHAYRHSFAVVCSTGEIVDSSVIGWKYVEPFEVEA